MSLPLSWKCWGSLAASLMVAWPSEAAGAQTRPQAKPEVSPPARVEPAAPPKNTAPPKTEAERKISATDTLFITIVGEAGLQTDFRVSSSGTIQFPYLDVVPVAGLTPTEVTTKLRELLMKDYFVDPQVLVTVKDYRSDFVTVTGQVVRPGPILLTGERKYDIIEVIAMAGGTTRLASNTIEYIHRGELRKLSLDKLKTELDAAKRIWVEPGDIIDVKETWM